jgi:hypothetical protein
VEVDTFAATARRGALADLLTTGTRTGTALAHRPQLALVDELTGALAALTDAPALRAAALAGRGLGLPPATPGYRPPAALDRYVRHRDRRCRFPGCRTRAARCDLDHTTPWPAGSTTATNLSCLCRHHHRLRHQAPGWTLHAHPDGALRWTTPTGQVRTTHPPDHDTSDTHGPPPPDRSATEQPGSGPPRAPTPPADAPPPF